MCIYDSNSNKGTTELPLLKLKVSLRGQEHVEKDPDAKTGKHTEQRVTLITYWAWVKEQTGQHKITQGDWKFRQKQTSPTKNNFKESGPKGQERKTRTGDADKLKE